MRKRFEQQHELGVPSIEEIIIPTKSRDELPPVLMALQYIFVTEELSAQVFDLLEQRIELKKMGREGLSLWEILVLGVVRLTLGTNYDRLEHIANYDSLVRELLGVKDEFGKVKKQYSTTSLKENIRYIDESFLIEVNELIVKAGTSTMFSNHHSLLKKKDVTKTGQAKSKVKIDSYVLESTVHFPTDTSLLYDSVKSSIRTVEKILVEVETDIKGWRKSKYWNDKAKLLSRKLSKIVHGGGKRKHQRVKKATNQYLKTTRIVSNKIKLLKKEIEFVKLTPLLLSHLEKLNYYEQMLDKHIDLVERRLVKGETIPHEEKVFSIYEPYTEWINKGKSGNRIELGLKIAVCTDQHGFILHHSVMEKQADAVY